MLGTTLLTARGEVLRFGGQVMKNVAGYDVSRLLAGSLGVLGVIAEVSLKVLPLPAAEQTLSLELGEAEAIRRCNQSGRPAPADLGDTVGIRPPVGAPLGCGRSGERCDGQAGRRAAGAQSAAALWQSVREHTHGFFADAAVLWRLSLPPATPPLELTGRQLIEWAARCAGTCRCTTTRPRRRCANW